MTDDRIVDGLAAEVKRLRDENRQLRMEAGGMTADGRTVSELEARVAALEDTLRQIAEYAEFHPPAITAVLAREALLDAEEQTNES